MLEAGIRAFALGAGLLGLVTVAAVIAMLGRMSFSPSLRITYGATIIAGALSLMAGNAGLNLTAADYVFLFDPWWNVAMQQQAIDRAHRIGQKKNVFAYKMACRDTIEEKIMLLQERKKALAEELIGVEEGFVKNLSLEDIEFLFK